MVFSPLRLLLPRWFVAFEKQMPNASWRRRGVASARGGGSPILGTERKRRGKDAGLHKRSAEAWGYSLRARWAELPLGLLLLLLLFRPGRALRAGTGPLRRVAKDHQGRRQEEAYSRSMSMFLGTSIGELTSAK